jgi:hypothetical protein
MKKIRTAHNGLEPFKEIQSGLHQNKAVKLFFYIVRPYSKLGSIISFKF